jgi:thymidylate kinase
MGKIIALSGIDGSGKSTAGIFIKEYITNEKLKSPRYIITFNHFILKQILKLPIIKKITERKRSDVFDKNKNNKKKKLSILNRILLFFWRYLVYFDILIYVLYTKWFSKHIYIYDRYIHDFYVSFCLMGCKLPVYKWMVKIFPKPHIHFYFYAETEDLFFRINDSHSLTREDLENAKILFNNLFDNNSSIKRVNTSILNTGEVHKFLKKTLNQKKGDKQCL